MAPFSAATGLGALAAAISKALRGLDHQVTVVSPLYTSIDPTAHALARRLSTIPVTIDGEASECILCDGRTTGGVDVQFVGHPRFGDGPATTPEAALAHAALLAQAAAEIVKVSEPAAEVVHALGNQAALSLALCRQAGASIGTVFTPGDLTAPCPIDASAVAELQLPQAVLDALGGAAGPLPDLLAAGASAADRVITSSSASADALADGSLAPSIASALAGRTDAICGVLDGVDAAIWNPLTDPQLPTRYDPADLGGKAQCKSALQYETGLPVRPDTPIVAVLADGVAEADVASIAETARALARNEVQLVIATTAEPDSTVVSLCEALQEQVQGLHVGEDVNALHRLFAGADFVWVPGPAHPQGNLHLAASRYGSIPIVLDSGLTGETVVDCDMGLETGTGMTYDGSPDGALSALQRALSAYAKTDAFEALQRRTMRADTSWERSARRYEHLYRGLSA